MATLNLIAIMVVLGQVGSNDPGSASVENRVSLVVATKESPPFAFRGPDGQWTGISIELWRHVANDLRLNYTFKELKLDQMFDAIESGEADAAVAAISVTADRHERVEFCHPHYTTGLGIAVANHPTMDGWKILRRIVSTNLLILIGIMICIVLVCGVLFWVFERHFNEQMFGGKRRQGIGMGMWWSTILLLGHKGVQPVSTLGRLLAGSAMITSIMLLSILTGVIASVLTVGQLDVGISNSSDLKHVRTVTVESSTSEDYLKSRRIPYRSYQTVAEATKVLAEGQADALVYDESLLKYLANNEYYGRIDVLPITFNKQEYAIALQTDSPLRKPLNRSILRFRASDGWDELVYRYLGQGRLD